MLPEEGAPKSTRSLITSGSFARFFWAAVIGSTGDWITVFAMITLADNIGSQQGILIALMARILPGLLLGGVVGVISDRMDRRKLVVLADVGRGVIVPFLAIVNSMPTLVAITLVLELLSLVGQPPRTAMVPRLVKTGEPGFRQQHDAGRGVWDDSARDFVAVHDPGAARCDLLDSSRPAMRGLALAFASTR